MTAHQLAAAEARYQQAAARAEALRSARNSAVRAALAAGWTHARIAETTGLTRGRVGQLARAGTMLDPDPANGPATLDTSRPPAHQEDSPSEQPAR